MGYPCLIPSWALNAEVTVNIAGGGVSEDGEQMPDIAFEGKCNLQWKAERDIDAQRQSAKSIGKAYFPGDICPTIAQIKGGTLTHNGVDYTISAGSKAINFDGTVNYTELELI